MSGWRKIAPAIWGDPRNPQIYGEIDVDATPIVSFIDDVRAEQGTRVTVTHVVGRAIAHALAEHPDLNCSLAGEPCRPAQTGAGTG